MKFIRTFALITLAALTGAVMISCDESEETVFASLVFDFSHTFDGSPVTEASFDNQFDYVTQNGDTISLDKLRYLVSDFRFYTADGDSILIEDYTLIDVRNGTGLTFNPGVDIPQGDYTGVSFVFGFTEDKNIPNAYPDLNAASWNWPEMLGGGYHFMQMEGMWLDQGVAKPYAYHNGTARVSEGVFEQNYFLADLGPVTLNRSNATFSIEMDIAEWYRNPHTWDLSQYSTTLMPNYDAQKLMQANGKSVFSLTGVMQED